MRRIAFWSVTLLAAFCLTLGLAAAQQLPQTGVTILVNRDDVNIRLLPAIGAEVVGFVDAGWTATATGRSPDNQWIRIDFNGEEAWIGVPVVNIFGDINTLPVADPRSIPYGGFESPRAGLTGAGGPISGRLANSGIRVRAGPSRAYPVLANAPRYTVMPLLGRTANNAWLQVNFEGTLGWIATQHVEIQEGASIISLPIDGIVADNLPISEATVEDYVGTLKFLLARVELAQPSLDGIRGIWTNVALGGRTPCGGYPASPTDYNIPNPVLAANYPILNPLQTTFNDAMTNVRLSIDLWIQACTLPGAGFVSQATVQGAFDAINLADGQFAELRRRLNELIPPERVPGPNECLFTFAGESDILPIINLSSPYVDRFDARRFAAGYCFDAAQSQNILVEVIKLSGNMAVRVAISPFDNPTNFLATGSGGTTQNLVNAGPLIIPATGRYLFIIADGGDQGREDPLQAELIFSLTDISTGLVTQTVIDLQTGQPYTNPVTVQFATPQPSFTPVPTFAPGGGGGTAGCASTSFTCAQLLSCAEAYACMAAGNTLLDPDGDGIPCEETLCS